ncbi:hypothetical protein LZ30DRAFT_283496 [Colletotrichum cereale]|nr:hypothetical protein LZ30DRAFT_283496 [Colletotrichum cereale]
MISMSLVSNTSKTNGWQQRDRVITSYLQVMCTSSSSAPFSPHLEDINKDHPRRRCLVIQNPPPSPQPRFELELTRCHSASTGYFATSPLGFLLPVGSLEHDRGVSQPRMQGKHSRSHPAGLCGRRCPSPLPLNSYRSWV